MQHGIEFVDMFAGVKEHTCPDGSEEARFFVLEDNVRGQFVKWCSNYGYVNQDNIILQR